MPTQKAPRLFFLILAGCLICFDVLDAPAKVPNAVPIEADKPKSDEEAEAPLPGYVVTRASGGFLTLTVENSAFVLSFYDKKKKPVAPDVTRAVIRYESANYRVRIPVQVLHPEGENTLASPPGIKPPYVYKIFLSLYVGESSDPVESYSFNINLSQ